MKNIIVGGKVLLKETVKTLLGSVREYKKASILTSATIAGEVLVECFIPLVMADLIDVMSGGDMLPILKYGIALLIMAMVSLGFGMASGWYGATASCGFAKNLRQDLFFKVQDYAFADIDKFSTSSLVTRLTTDITNVQMAYQMILRIAVRTPLMLIFSVIMSVSINAKMSLIFAGIVPFLGVALFLIIRKVRCDE